MAEIIDGRALAKELRASIDQHIDVLVKDHGILPGLAVVLVGEDPASLIYVKNKQKMAAEVGIKTFVHHLPEDTPQDKVQELIVMMNNDDAVHGIIVQLPLPEHINAAEVLETVSPHKDVDGLHSGNAGKLAQGVAGMVPCTPMGVLALIKKAEPKLEGLHAVVVGRSNLVGKPTAQLLLREDCTVTICHSRSANISHITRQADILVVATGQAQMVTAEWVKPGAIVIDVGISRVEGGKITGDVDFEDVARVAKHITTVPGGVGPMTIACLLGNTLVAACRQNGLTVPHIG